VKRSSDTISIDRRKAELCGYALLAMGYLRRIGFLGLALMTSSWCFNPVSAETPRSKDHLDQYLDGRADATMGWSDTGWIF
jgi:hypothetical protein